jgi:ABC-type multidrug transport system fused ATPase/permease subunit
MCPITLRACLLPSLPAAHSWSVTLVVTAALPVLIASNGLLAKLAFGAQAIDREALSHANAMATEALGAIKTVAAFNMQPSYVRLYQKELQRSAPAWSALLAGLGFGCSQFFLLGVTSLGFWFGGTQVGAGKLGFKEMLTANMAVFYAAFGLAQVGECGVWQEWCEA